MDQIFPIQTFHALTAWLLILKFPLESILRYISYVIWLLIAAMGFV